jgi:hypothetical protein
VVIERPQICDYWRHPEVIGFLDRHGFHVKHFHGVCTG